MFCRHISAAALVVLLAVAGGARGQEWPTRPIVVVSPFIGGTTNDLAARVVLEHAAQQVSQPFTIENRPGGDGTVGVGSVVKARPDGYTMLLSSSALSTAFLLHKSQPYDVLRDLAPVAMFGGQPGVMVGSAEKRARTVAALVAAAKANPGKLKFGSLGVGTAAYIAAERFCLAAGLNVQHVAFRGPADALTALAAGDIDFYFLPIPPALPLLQRGRVAALAVTASKRSSWLPNVPTLAESGYAVAPYLIWDGLAAPAKTPRSIIDKVNADVAQSLARPDVRQKLYVMGYEAIPMSPEQSTKFLADDVAATIKLGKDAQVTPRP